LRGGPQRIERRERDSVVVVSEAVWTRLAAEYPSFADLVLNVSRNRRHMNALGIDCIDPLEALPR